MPKNYIITDRKLYGFVNGVSMAVLELRADTAADLPTTAEEPSMLMGSIAAVMDESAFYMLKSSGEWSRWEA